MSLTVTPIEQVFRYNGVTLQAPAGATPEMVKKLHSAIYPELTNCQIEIGEVSNGKRIITFKRPEVRDKGCGATFADFKDMLRAEIDRSAPATAEYLLLNDLAAPAAQRASKALVQLCRAHEPGLAAPSAMLDLMG